MAETETRHHSRLVRPLLLTRKGRPGPLLWVALLFALYAAGIGLVLPYFAKPYLEKEFSGELGVPCTIGTLTVNPLTLQIIARNLDIPYPEATRDKTGEYMVRLARLEMVPALRSLSFKTLVLEELRLDRPQFFLTQLEDGTLSPQLFFADGKDAPQEEETDLFPIVFHNISVRNGTLTIADALHKTTHTITAIDLAVPFVSTLRADHEIPLTPTLSAEVNGRKLVAKGETLPFTANRQTVFSLWTHDLNLRDYAGYIQTYSSLNLKSGRLHAELTLRFEAEAEKAFDFALAGSLELTDLVLADREETVFSVARFAVDAENVVIGPRRVLINDALMEKPEILVRRAKNGVINWENFFTLPQEASQSGVRITSRTGEEVPIPGLAGQKTPHGLPLQLVVKNSRVTDGKITWQDNVPRTPVRYTAENVNGHFSDISTTDQGNADFSLSFGKGNASASARGRTTITPMRLDCAVNVGNLPLAPFYPYLPEGHNLRLAGGLLHLAGDVTLQRTPVPLVSVNLGSIALSGVSARMNDQPETPFLSLGRIAAEQVAVDAVKQTLHIGKVTGTGINTTLLRDISGEIALPVLSATPTATTSVSPAPADAWQISVAALDINKSAIAFTDESLRRKASLPLDNISVTGGNFANHGDKRWTIALAASSGEQGKLALSLRGTLNPLRLTFSGSVNRADLTTLSPYLQETTRLRLMEGSLNSEFSGNLRRVPGSKAGGSLAVKGNVSVNGVSLSHRGKELGGWGRLRADTIDYRLPPSGKQTCSIEKITLNRPRLSVVIDAAGVTTLQTALQREKPAETPHESPPEPAPNALEWESLTIGTFPITLGQANYLDNRVSPPYRLRVNDINAHIAGLSLDPEAYASFTGSLMVNGSPVIASGVVKSLFATPSGSGTLGVRSLDLSRFTQYAEKYLGYPLKRGDLTATVIASLQGRNLSMHNSVLIRKLDLGKKVESPDAADLPLSAAVSLLRDSDGSIALELPVSGTLGDPEFKLGGVVGKVIASVILKTVTSPLALVGGILGGFLDLLTQTGPSTAEIVFPVGERTLDAAGKEALEALGEEFRKHPRAILEITGMADWGEKNMLIDAWVDQALRRRKYNALPPEEKAKTTPEAVLVGPEHNVREYTRLLFDFYKGLRFVKESKDRAITSPASTRAIMRILRSRRDMGEEELLTLARSRAVVVYHALSRGKIDIAARIRLQDSVLKDISTTGDRIASYARIRIIRN